MALTGTIASGVGRWNRGFAAVGVLFFAPDSLGVEAAALLARPHAWHEAFPSLAYRPSERMQLRPVQVRSE